ncbi:hypothetical protein Plec18167_005137 [Paecilomyces lecythidis]|uniref:FAD/NAD(P)-binding domain-containing protein n=1 Tax=Paecilomyces lecythidis TaxID=3004212 RepID=A0ABR3XL64_9EURO
MTPLIKNIVVVGGSYVGRATAQELARIIPKSHRVLLIEPHTHFNHLFAFPRFAIVPDHEHKAFIPYSNLFAATPDPSTHAVVQARVLSVQPQHVKVDREWQGSKEIPFEYLAIATGTVLSPPGNMPSLDKQSSIQYLRKYQSEIKRAKSIVIAGGGAVGVQMATDLKEYYPNKEVTVVQSRPRVMPQFHEKFHGIVQERFDELGVRLTTGARVVIPSDGFPNDGSTFQVKLTNGTEVEAGFVIPATGQTANNELVKGLPASASDSIINPQNGYIRVKPTMQFADEKYPNFFAVGDIADTGAHKAARPGAAQAAVVAKNIQALIEGRSADETFSWGPRGIHLTLGLKKNVIFRDPNVAEGETEPTIMWKDDGREDMGVEGIWKRMGMEVTSPQQYHL